MCFEDGALKRCGDGRRICPTASRRGLSRGIFAAARQNPLRIVARESPTAAGPPADAASLPRLSDTSDCSQRVGSLLWINAHCHAQLNDVMSAKRIPRPLLWIGGIIAFLLLVVLILSLLDWNALRGPLSRMISRDIERPVSINGNLRVHLFSWTPSAEVEGLTIGNPDWAGKDNMVELPRLYVAVVLKDEWH